MNALRQRCRELLADRASHDLTPQSAEELQQLLTLHPEWENEDSMETAAAAMHLALLGEIENMPGDVLQRLHERAGRWRSPGN